MNCKFVVLFAVLATMANALLVAGDVGEMEHKMEESTDSPIADMTMIDPELKTSTERPPVASSDMASAVTHEKLTEAEKDGKPNAQRHTVADFIIHPLIAFKPRVPEEDPGAPKQAAGDATTTTTPSPWQLFGFNAGQGFGSSISSVAGSVTGWLNDRIQLPGLVDSPVRESTTTSTTTTTTQRPDVVVRVQHKATSRRPIISINNRNRPNRVNNNALNFGSEEDDDDFDDEDNYDDEDNANEEYDDDLPNKRPQRVNRPNKRRQQQQVQEEYDDSQSDESENDVEDDEDDEEEEEVQRPNRRRPVQNNQNNRRRQQQQNNRRNSQRERVSVGTQRQQSVGATPNLRRRPQKTQQAEESESAEEEESGEAEVEADEEEEPEDARRSTKRSQNQANFIQRGQQSLINQIRQLTRGQTPAEIGALMRKSQQQQNGKSKKRRRNQATLVVNRNGQTIYMAPELLQVGESGGLLNPNLQYYTQALRAGSSAQQFPQPPLTVPLKRKGQATQYITIPWSQLGIAPPDQVVALTEGVQSTPLILNIPQSAINTINNPARRRRPVVTPDAVPLLAEASLMDVFKPPKIPPSRHSTASPAHKPGSLAAGTPVIIASKPKPKPKPTNHNSPALLPHRIRPATIVEKAPANAENSSSDAMQEDSDEEPAQTVVVQTNDELRNNDDFIIVGEDNEPGLTRQVQPVFGEARYVYGDNRPYFEVLNRRRFAFRKSGRSLEQPEEQLIPVQIINDGEEPVKQEKEQMKDEKKVEMEMEKIAKVEEAPKVEEVVKVEEKPKAEEVPKVEEATKVKSTAEMTSEAEKTVAPAATT